MNPFLDGLHDELVKLAAVPVDGHAGAQVVPRGVKYERGLPRVVNKGKPMQVRPMKIGVPSKKNDKFLNELGAADKKIKHNTNPMEKNDSYFSMAMSQKAPRLSKTQIKQNRQETRGARSIVSSALNAPKKQKHARHVVSRKPSGPNGWHLNGATPVRGPDPSWHMEGVKPVRGQDPSWHMEGVNPISGSRSIQSNGFNAGETQPPPRPAIQTGNISSAAGGVPQKPKPISQTEKRPPKPLFQNAGQLRMALPGRSS